MYLDELITLIKDNRLDEKIITDLQQSVRTSRWSKPSPVCIFFC